MVVVKGIESLDFPIIHPVITVGNFDGVHLAHQKIIQLALEKAKARNGVCVAYTFRPHPKVALKPGLQLSLLSTYDEKLELLESLGVDVAIEEPFSREFSTIEPEQFFTDVLLRQLSAEAIVVGYDFAFGKERHGHLDVLAKFCEKAGVELTVVSPQRLEGEVVSSSKVRQYLLAGNIEFANRLLGRNFFYRGVVIRGDARGRKIGFPTANLRIENKLTLPLGVYATWAIHEGKKFPSVTNVGIRPTFQADEHHENQVLVETHILDRTIDLYGTTLEVQFVSKLREEKKFSSIQDLKDQITRDVQNAKAQLTI